MPLDIDNGLSAIHMRFGNSYTNEAIFCTRVNSCAVMNVGNLRLHKWIITTNPDIVESYIQFDDENPFDPIRFNFAFSEEKSDLKGGLTSLVTYKTCYKDAFKNLLLSFILVKDVAFNSIIGKPTFKSGDKI